MEYRDGQAPVWEMEGATSFYDITIEAIVNGMVLFRMKSQKRDSVAFQAVLSQDDFVRWLIDMDARVC